MFSRKAPIWNAAVALGNLAEGLFWFNAYLHVPTADNALATNECIRTALENVAAFALPYIMERKGQKQNAIGAIANGLIGGAHYFFTNMLFELPGISLNDLQLNGVTPYVSYPPRSVSSIFQPIMNTVGLGLNSYEAYYKKSPKA